MAIKVPDCAAEKQDEQVLTRLALRSDLQEAIEILAFKAQDTDRINVPEFALTLDQSRVRDFNGIIGSALATAERFEQPAGFPAAAAA